MMATYCPSTVKWVSFKVSTCVPWKAGFVGSFDMLEHLVMWHIFSFLIVDQENLGCCRTYDRLSRSGWLQGFQSFELFHPFQEFHFLDLSFIWWDWYIKIKGGYHNLTFHFWPLLTFFVRWGILIHDQLLIFSEYTCQPWPPLRRVIPGPIALRFS